MHRNYESYKTDCPWHANFYLEKQTNLIKLTKLDENHNYPCDPETIDLAPKNIRLPQQIIDKIEHYIKDGCLSAGQQYNLLVNEFSESNIRKKNLYNAIQKFHGIRMHNETDAATMLLHLLKLHDEDPRYFVLPRLEGLANELIGLF